MGGQVLKTKKVGGGGGKYLKQRRWGGGGGKYLKQNKEGIRQGNMVYSLSLFEIDMRLTLHHKSNIDKIPKRFLVDVLSVQRSFYHFTVMHCATSSEPPVLRAL